MNDSYKSRISKIAPDRYADTGFAVKDTPPEVNAKLFAAMMRRTPEERMLMGLSMMATARELAWSGLAGIADVAERRRVFLKRFHGLEMP